MIHNDHLGTPQKMTDSSGAVVWAADYKPFGEVTVTISTIANNLRFPGQYFDAETGLNYNYYRDYNPGIGRYVEKDSIGILLGRNHLFAYVGNNPVNSIDPSGLLSPGPTIDPGLITSDPSWSRVNHSGYVVYNPYAPYDAASEPFIIIGGGVTILLHDFGVNSAEGITRGHSTSLVGISGDVTCGSKGDVEIGLGARRLGAGINFDRNGITGISMHYGFSWPPSPVYGSVSK